MEVLNKTVTVITLSIYLQYLLHHLLALSRWTDERVWHRSHVTAVAWALLQDSYHTSLCLRHQPNLVATAVLYLALHCCKVEVPGSKTAERQWWQVFYPDTEEKELQAIAKDIMAFCDTASNKDDGGTSSGSSSSSSGRSAGAPGSSTPVTKSISR